MSIAPTTSHDHDASVAGLTSVSLDELNHAAALQERVDRKYVVTPSALAALLTELGEQFAVLESDGLRSFSYESTYFDTEAFDSYLGAAYGRRRRFKVRTRTYLDSATTMLEVKTKARRGQTVKSRQPHSFFAQDELGDAGRSFVSTVLGPADPPAALVPTLKTSYRRTTLLQLHKAARVTIDANLRASGRSNAEMALPHRLVIETKSSGAPSLVDRWFWGHGIRPDRISKFGVGLAILHPELPSNRWHRTIDRHFSA